MMLQGHTYSAICLLVTVDLAVSPSAENIPNSGENGELWSADSRLPFFPCGLSSW